MAVAVVGRGGGESGQVVGSCLLTCEEGTALLVVVHDTDVRTTFPTQHGRVKNH